MVEVDKELYRFQLYDGPPWWWQRLTRKNSAYANLRPNYRGRLKNVASFDIKEERNRMSSWLELTVNARELSQNSTALKKLLAHAGNWLTFNQGRTEDNDGVPTGMITSEQRISSERKSLSFADQYIDYGTFIQVESYNNPDNERRIIFAGMVMNWSINAQSHQVSIRCVSLGHMAGEELALDMFNPGFLPDGFDTNAFNQPALTASVMQSICPLNSAVPNLAVIENFYNADGTPSNARPYRITIYTHSNLNGTQYEHNRRLDFNSGFRFYRDNTPGSFRLWACVQRPAWPVGRANPLIGQAAQNLEAWLQTGVFRSSSSFTQPGATVDLLNAINPGGQPPLILTSIDANVFAIGDTVNATRYVAANLAGINSAWVLAREGVELLQATTLYRDQTPGSNRYWFFITTTGTPTDRSVTAPLSLAQRAILEAWLQQGYTPATPLGLPYSRYEFIQKNPVLIMFWLIYFNNYLDWDHTFGGEAFGLAWQQRVMPDGSVQDNPPVDELQDIVGIITMEYDTVEAMIEQCLEFLPAQWGFRIDYDVVENRFPEDNPNARVNYTSQGNRYAPYFRLHKSSPEPDYYLTNGVEVVDYDITLSGEEFYTRVIASTEVVGKRLITGLTLPDISNPTINAVADGTIGGGDDTSSGDDGDDDAVAIRGDLIASTSSARTSNAQFSGTVPDPWTLSSNPHGVSLVSLSGNRVGLRFPKTPDGEFVIGYLIVLEVGGVPRLQRLIPFTPGLYPDRINNPSFLNTSDTDTRVGVYLSGAHGSGNSGHVLSTSGSVTFAPQTQIKLYQALLPGSSRGGGADGISDYIRPVKYDTFNDSPRGSALAGIQTFQDKKNMTRSAQFHRTKVIKPGQQPASNADHITIQKDLLRKLAERERAKANGPVSTGTITVVDTERRKIEDYRLGDTIGLRNFNDVQDNVVGVIAAKQTMFRKAILTLNLVLSNLPRRMLGLENDFKNFRNRG